MNRVTTSATTETTTTTETARLQSLAAKAGVSLSSLEENVLRMHHGISIRTHAELATNGTTQALMTQLVELEVDAHMNSGRAEELGDVPHDAAMEPNAHSKRILEALKNKG